MSVIREKYKLIARERSKNFWRRFDAKLYCKIIII